MLPISGAAALGSIQIGFTNVGEFAPPHKVVALANITNVAERA